MAWVSSTDYTDYITWENVETTVSENFVEIKTTLHPALLFTNDTSNIPTMSTTSSSVPTKTYPYDMLAVTAASAFIIAFLGTCGNLFTIIALPMYRKLRNTATAFVVNLGVVEMIFCLTVLPMNGAQYMYLYLYDQSLLSERSCIFFAVFRYGLTQVELQTILGIALTRALAVSLPTLYRKINSPVVMGCYLAGMWLYSFLLKLPTAIGILGHYTFNSKTMKCDLGYDAASIKARFIAIIVEVAVPMFTIIFLYIYILVMVKLSSARVARSSMRGTKSSSSTGENSRPGSTRSRELSSTSSFQTLKRLLSQSSLKKRANRTTSNLSQMSTRRRDLRVARTIFIIFLMVIVCSFPVGYVHFIDSKVTQPRRFLAVHILYWVQYCLNLVVYVFLNRQYRDAYIECLARVLPSFEKHKGFKFAWERQSMSSHPANVANTSLKQRKDSDISEPSQNLLDKDQNAVPSTSVLQSPRLSMIPEANTTSNGDSDEVFLSKQNQQDQQLPEEASPLVQTPSFLTFKSQPKNIPKKEGNV